MDISIEQRQEIVRQYDNGAAPADIAELLGIARLYVYVVLHEMVEMHRLTMDMGD